jgi:hypothetical protein
VEASAAFLRFGACAESARARIAGAPDRRSAGVAATERARLRWHAGRNSSSTKGHHKETTMSTITTTFGLFAVAALALATPASADDCKGIGIDVKNNKKTTIKALSVEYKFDADNTWRKEGFSNVEVSSGAFKAVANNQNLEHGQNQKLVGLKLHYKALCGGKWSKEFVSAVDSTFDDHGVCKSNNNRRYRVDLSGSDVCTSH